jgi:hypothetical protein
MKGLKAGEGASTEKDRKTLLGGTNVSTARKRDIGKMNALIRGKRKRKGDSGCHQIQGSYNLETDAA